MGSSCSLTLCQEPSLRPSVFSPPKEAHHCFPLDPARFRNPHQACALQPSLMHPLDLGGGGQERTSNMLRGDLDWGHSPWHLADGWVLPLPGPVPSCGKDPAQTVVCHTDLMRWQMSNLLQGGTRRQGKLPDGPDTHSKEVPSANRRLLLV